MSVVIVGALDVQDYLKLQDDLDRAQKQLNVSDKLVESLNSRITQENQWRTAIVLERDKLRDENERLKGINLNLKLEFAKACKAVDDIKAGVKTLIESADSFNPASYNISVTDEVGVVQYCLGADDSRWSNYHIGKTIKLSKSSAIELCHERKKLWPNIQYRVLNTTGAVIFQI
jgi:hypothetical protein